MATSTESIAVADCKLSVLMYAVPPELRIHSRDCAPHQGRIVK